MKVVIMAGGKGTRIASVKSDVPKRMYANFPAGIHSMYIGEVVNAWKK